MEQYDRIDPNDVQALKDEIEDLQIDLRKAEEEKAAYTAEKEAQAKLVRLPSLYWLTCHLQFKTI